MFFSKHFEHQEVKKILASIHFGRESAVTDMIKMTQLTDALQEREEKLKLSYDMWEATFDSVSDPIMIVNTTFEIKKANHSFCEWVGVPEGEIYGMKCYETVHKIYAPNEKCFALGVIQTGQPFHTEVKTNDKWFEVSINALKYQSQTLGTIHVFRDITDLKKAQRELVKLASFPLLNPNPILEVNKAGEVTFANPAALKVLDEAGLRTKTKSFFPYDFMDCLKQWDNMDKKPYNSEVYVGDRIYDVAVSFVPEFKVIRLYCRNITKLKKAWEELRDRNAEKDAILQAAPIGIGRVRITETSRIITWMNTYFLNMLGYTSEELVGKDARMLYLNDEDYHRMEQMYQPHTGPIVEYATHFVRKDGIVLSIHIHAAPVEGNEAVIICVTDVCAAEEIKRLQDIIIEGEKDDKPGV